jgi:hypothetical protein
MRAYLLFVLLFSLARLQAQDPSSAAGQPSVSDDSHLGIGAGLDHGGIGLRVDVPVTRHVALIAGVGYAIVGAGWNAGLQYRFLPDSKVGLYVQAIYGYNGVIKVEGAAQYDDIYYGPSVGAGLEFRRSKSSNYFHLALLVPFRSSEFWSDWESLEDNNAIEVKQGPLPIAFSIGYHFAL